MNENTRPRIWDRVLVLCSYVLLVVAVAWSSWDTHRRLDQLDRDLCGVALVELVAVALALDGGDGSDEVQSAIAELLDRCA